MTMQTDVTVFNQLNTRKRKTTGEVNTGPSLTVPDQSLTVREILIRYASGIPIDAGRVPVFDENEDELPDFRKMDLADRQEYAHAYAQELAELKRKHTEQPAPPAEPETPPVSGAGEQGS